ncbi:MAG: M42 family metallopeptidase [bacterium]|jgi:putative aminopeptidase FrvX
MNFALLKRLCEAPGTPGREDAVRAIIIEELKPHVTDIKIDAMGNVIAFKQGTGKGTRRKVMLAAHMDEIGFMVKHIEDKGFLRLYPFGGIDTRNMFAQQVVVTTKDGPIKGLLGYATKPAHMLSDAERNQSAQMENFFVDVGLSGDEAKKKIQVGDIVTMDRPCEEIGENIACKAMDDRVGVYVMIEAMKNIEALECDVYAVGTVQEEVGLRGATTAAFGVNPDVGIALDVTLTGDYPGAPDADTLPKLGGGAAIKILDSSLICHPKLVEHFKDIATAKEITHQMELLPRGGTDAGAIQRAQSGVVSITLSIPTRYVHTVNETVSPIDVDAAVNLLARYLEEAHTRDYSYV